MWSHGGHDFLGASVNYSLGRVPTMPGAFRVSSERASTILREVSPEKAFYFYKEVGSPLNVSASSLKEFLQRISTVEPVSLTFHSDRKDFESWVSMLGDDELSKRLAGVRGAGLQDEALRTRLYSTTKTRLNQLTQLSKNKSQ